MSERAAFFDVDGTLIRANCVHYYTYFLKRGLGPAARTIRFLEAMVKLPYWWILDRIDRARFCRHFYAHYQGFPVRDMKRLAQDCFEEVFRQRFMRETFERLERHREAGDRVILVSGSPDVILEPLVAYLKPESVLCSSLEHDEESFSGRLLGSSVVGEEKVRAVIDYARRNGVDLKESYAYGDSASDAPLLEIVGHPVAVNPTRALRKAAQRHGWEILAGRGPV
jgi:HAD superfamily hydrolase (TIGR01490 family)